MEIQTRSYGGEICTFPTLSKALGFAQEINLRPLLMDVDNMDELIWKISFPLENGERVRLLWNLETKSWFLEQMEDAVTKALNERAADNRCVVCDKPAVQWTPGGYCCAAHFDDFGGATC